MLSCRPASHHEAPSPLSPSATASDNTAFLWDTNDLADYRGLRSRFHPDCPDVPSTARPMAGTASFVRPEESILVAASLPTELNQFRVGNFAVMMISTERFIDAVRRPGLDDILFRELPTR